MVNISQLKRDLPDICKRYRIAYVDAFGSLARGEENDNSDIDLIIEFEEPREAQITKRYFGFHEELEGKYGQKVDILTERALKNPFLIKAVNRDRTRVYG